MRIFASWSGAQSRQVAELLRWWIPNVVQDADVYVSSQDIAKGERWQANVGANLTEIDFGIVAVTPTNLNAPWIQFEAGALSKAVRSRLIPLLCGMDAIQAANNPLKQFQYALVKEDELLRVVEEINAASERRLDPERLKGAFEKWLPDFMARYQTIDFAGPKAAKKESDTTRLENIEEAISEVMVEIRRIRAVNDSNERSKAAWAADLMPNLHRITTITASDIAAKAVVNATRNLDAEGVTALQALNDEVNAWTTATPLKK